jgi:hypothetical protein
MEGSASIDVQPRRQWARREEALAAWEQHRTGGSSIGGAGWGPHDLRGPLEWGLEGGI